MNKEKWATEKAIKQMISTKDQEKFDEAQKSQCCKNRYRNTV